MILVEWLAIPWQSFCMDIGNIHIHSHWLKISGSFSGLWNYFKTSLECCGWTVMLMLM